MSAIYPLTPSKTPDIADKSAGAEDWLLEPVFTGKRELINVLGIALWLATLLYFWSWWLQPDHVYTAGRYAIVTCILLWVTLIPAYFIFIFARARIPVGEAKPFPAARVAMVVTKTPFESFSVVKKTLQGALAQDGYDHDTWLADEDPDAQTLEWCRQHGVRVSSRKNIAAYHRETWPCRTRCKEGNLAYFYDHFGYDRYDFISQFDADHVPSPDYLKHVLAPFVEPAVGYVSAPSICDVNADKSWSARGRLYVEASMHGALQAGYNSGWAPLCIGSHYTVRTAALRSVGGIGPELAEDHSTTLLLNAGGWRGVHAVDAIAHGEGPETFTGMALQEFQWSRSLVTIFFRYTPAYLVKLPARLRFQFLFSQLWYPMFSSMMALMSILPIIALASGSHFVNVNYIDYFTHILPLSVILLVLAYWWRSTGLFRPAHAKILSWESVAFLFLRWPWSLLGSLVALWDLLTGTRADFRITSKGHVHTKPIPFRIVAPYLVLAVASAGCAWLIDVPGTAAGFYIFSLITAFNNVLLVLLILYRHARENRLLIIPLNLPGFATAFSIVAICGLVAGATYENGPKGLAAMNVGITAFTLTQTVFLPTGAAMGRPGMMIVRFRPKWHGFSPTASN
jgi:cellulose synthase (UDP-forming)